MIKDFELTDIVNGNKGYREIISPEEVCSFAEHIENNVYRRNHTFHMKHEKPDKRECSYINYEGLRKVCFPIAKKIQKEPLEYHLIGDDIEICLRNIKKENGNKGIEGYIELRFATDEKDFDLYMSEIEQFWPKKVH
jgi:hypothetical protein